MSRHIHTLSKQYFQLVDVPQLSIPPNNVLIQPAVQEALYEHMFNESLTPLPPTTYRSRVLKLLLARIEEGITDPEEDEILDSLMETWANLLTTPKPSALDQAQQLSQIKYTAPTPPPTPSSSTTTTTPPRTVTISESRGVILSGGTTGNRTWEAALHLGSYLATSAGETLIRGKRVIELGAGTGFLSLFCAKHLGARAVVATDREPFLIDNMRACVGVNNREIEIEEDGREVARTIPMYPAIWDWGTKLETATVENEDGEGEGKEQDSVSAVGDKSVGFDIALGADLIYDADIIPLLISTVRDLFENYHIKQFIIAATLRNEKTFKTFLDACETNSFTVETLPFQSMAEEEQTGFFHSTSIPIHTYRILPSR
ncbi:hypothetical protein N7509_013193 [Penicillium cosmopolitanum]|uniref:FAM86 N-terminal domain-containing protein n=1 Tax=Penicillium cosmopolitanum TaxID=1131564 RepID=A0A9W9SDU2_9EURO|nr:uncharacterized protein N7509_013193 [Penicillium cosmopolitanum]KAJ5376307.1 hypothetical protein N7509_013193 [Penicillium cosmopolitanum]